MAWRRPGDKPLSESMLTDAWISPPLSQVGTQAPEMEPSSLISCAIRDKSIVSLYNCDVLVFRRVGNNKVHGANMGPIWGRQDPGGPHGGSMNFATLVVASKKQIEFAGTTTRVVEADRGLIIEYHRRSVLMVQGLGPVGQHAATPEMIRSQSRASVLLSLLNSSCY